LTDHAYDRCRERDGDEGREQFELDRLNTHANDS
jgi:hypothetical protein